MSTVCPNALSCKAGFAPRERADHPYDIVLERLHRAVPMEAFEGHDALAMLHLSDQAVSCAGLLPLLAWME